MSRSRTNTVNRMYKYSINPYFMLVFIFILLALFFLSVRCQEYNLTPQCDVKLYGDKCNSIDPYTSIKKECRSKLLPNLILYSK